MPMPIALPRTMPSMPADRCQDNGFGEKLKQDFAFDARPRARRTPISRVRSVTEIDIIAMTPIPPTIRAMDEITTKSEECRLADLVPTRMSASWVRISKSFWLVQSQAVTASHDALDVRDRVFLADPLTRDRGQHAPACHAGPRYD